MVDKLDILRQALEDTDLSCILVDFNEYDWTVSDNTLYFELITTEFEEGEKRYEFNYSSEIYEGPFTEECKDSNWIMYNLSLCTGDTMTTFFRKDKFIDTKNSNIV